MIRPTYRTVIRRDGVETVAYGGKSYKSAFRVFGEVTRNALKYSILDEVYPPMPTDRPTASVRANGSVGAWAWID